MTNLLTALLLGTLQGFTEFLPVSSSGHLVIAQSILPSFNAPPVLFDAVLHLGTLLAILVYFKRQILALNLPYIKLLVVASIPAFVFGLALNQVAERLFESLTVVGLGLLVTGFLNMQTNKVKKGNAIITNKVALFIGVFQAIAIIPGISRSGSTIFAGTAKGIAKKEVAQFSFLLSVPAVLGANFLQITKASDYVIDIPFFAVGFICAFIAGLIAIKLVIKALEHKTFKVFSYYCFALGTIVLLKTIVWG